MKRIKLIQDMQSLLKGFNIWMLPHGDVSMGRLSRENMVCMPARGNIKHVDDTTIPRNSPKGITNRGLRSPMPFPGNQIFPGKIREISRPEHSGTTFSRS